MSENAAPFAASSQISILVKAGFSVSGESHGGSSVDSATNQFAAESEPSILISNIIQMLGRRRNDRFVENDGIGRDDRFWPTAAV